MARALAFWVPDRRNLRRQEAGARKSAVFNIASFRRRLSVVRRKPSI